MDRTWQICNTAKVIEYFLRILDTLGNKEGFIKGSLCNITDLTMIENLGQAICNIQPLKSIRAKDIIKNCFLCHIKIT